MKGVTAVVVIFVIGGDKSNEFGKVFDKFGLFSNSGAIC